MRAKRSRLLQRPAAAFGLLLCCCWLAATYLHARLPPSPAPPLRPAAGAAPAAPPPAPPKRVIALYYPFFHELESDGPQRWRQGYEDFGALRAARCGFPVSRPLDGLPDLRSATSREQHGRLARHYGVHGFAYLHYWRGGAPFMHAPLEALLADGQPDLPFMLAWDNEEWAARWDYPNARARARLNSL